ncbi:oxidoreductase [Vibrio sp. T187]|uniref:oxidoreductase n=1 Tax=Vibrio TaxID=662 RepID=UPI0010C944FE|nr:MULTISPECIES: oxidoreductase [Vibrio]MBW3694917.1 oxidoreductase [Vibrio sp. T187]
MKVLLPLIACLFSAPIFAASITVSWDGSDKEPIVFEFDEISALPQVTYKTTLPWIEGKGEFTGVTLQALLGSRNIEMTEEITVRALNDYSVEVSKADIEAYKPIIAYLQNGERMRVRDKGPFWLIFSLSDHPKLNNNVYHSQMVWQLDRIQMIPNEK